MQISDTSLHGHAIPVHSVQWREFQLDMFTAIDPIRQTWDGYIRQQNVFLSGGYLSGLECCPPGGMTFYYILVRSADSIVGVIYMQLEEFQARRSLNYERLETGANTKRKGGVLRPIKEFVAGRISFYTLLCGNTLVTGSHGYHLNASISQAVELQMIDFTLGRVKEHAAKEGKDVRLVFIKDFFEPRYTSLHEETTCAQYHPFTAQPNMIMKLPDSWNSFDDYLSSLQSKYRVRVRRARKKLSGIVKKELDAHAIEEQQAALYALYLHIANRASFNLFILNEGYMASIKRQLGDKFRVFGYYLEGRLVAFYSMMENGDELEAHFLGYESGVNREKQLYLNMLLDMIGISIQRGIHRIVFSRTAMEIKSSVGAEPYYMYFYLQHSNATRNKYLPRVYNLLDPKVDWTPRSPFKSNPV